MWMFALFDLPVGTRQNRRNYTRFRKLLLAEGFSQLQYSVYARYIVSEEAAVPIRAKIKRALPPQGQVRLLSVTEKQFAKQHVFTAGKRMEAEDVPDQMLLF